MSANSRSDQSGLETQRRPPRPTSIGAVAEPGPDEKELAQIVLVRVMRLNAIVNGIAFGVISGLALFAVTLWLVIKGGPVVGPHLSLLGQYLPGYDVTLAGSFIGLGYGLLLGFLFGAFLALVYNRIVALRERRTA